MKSREDIDGLLWQHIWSACAKATAVSAVTVGISAGPSPLGLDLPLRETRDQVGNKGDRDGEHTHGVTRQAGCEENRTVSRSGCAQERRDLSAVRGISGAAWEHGFAHCKDVARERLEVDSWQRERKAAARRRETGNEQHDVMSSSVDRRARW